MVPDPECTSGHEGDTAARACGISPTWPRRDEARTTGPPGARILRRGWQRRCPHCGLGPALQGYLTLPPHCPVCRARPHSTAIARLAVVALTLLSDLLACVCFALLRHRLGGSPLLQIALLAIGIAALTLYLLPRLKALTTGWIWARGRGRGAR